MREFFQVVTLEQASSHLSSFPRVDHEVVSLAKAAGRILAASVTSEIDLPGFRRSTMDGFAVAAASTFGASDASPALLEVRGAIEMGSVAEVQIARGQAAQILTGGMLPPGADAVVMVEHTEALDQATIEVSRAVAPGQNVIEADEDVARGETLLDSGCRLRPQDVGLLAALGYEQVEVFRRPVVAILSTGDELVPVGATPARGQVRDVNSHTLSAMVAEAGGQARPLGIVADDRDQLERVSQAALSEADVVIISGGSSVGCRDHTLDVIASLADSELLFHGVAIKPGKPTILARVGAAAFWGLPGHVASAMVVFRVLVRPFLEYLGGLGGRVGEPRPTDGASTRRRPGASELPVPALLGRNIASAHGRREYIRVELEARDGELWAHPVLGKSGLLRPLVAAAGVIEIDVNTEGLDQGARVQVLLW